MRSPGWSIICDARPDVRLTYEYARDGTRGLSRMIWDPNKIRSLPWPGVDGKSLQYEIGDFGQGAPVRIIKTPGERGGYVSCRSLMHAQSDEVWSLIDCLEVAAQILDEED